MKSSTDTLRYHNSPISLSERSNGLLFHSISSNNYGLFSNYSPKSSHLNPGCNNGSVSRNMPNFDLSSNYITSNLALDRQSFDDDNKISPTTSQRDPVALAFGSVPSSSSDEAMTPLLDSLSTTEASSPSPISTKRYPYRSLLLSPDDSITTSAPGAKKLSKSRGTYRAQTARRKPASRSSSLKSVRSNKSSRSNFSGISNNTLHARIILDLPFELLDLILGYLDQRSLVNLLYVSRTIYRVTLPHIYYRPYFSSTYRFAQFVSVVSDNSELASNVRILDLSHITYGYKTDSTEVLAGWRDWKLRSEPLYSAGASHKLADGRTRSRSLPEENRKSSPSAASFKRKLSSGRLLHHSYADVESPRLSAQILTPEPGVSKHLRRYSPQLSNNINHSDSGPFSTPHPLQSPLLTRQFSASKDIPIGALIHVITSCTRLISVDLSRLPLANDYLVRSDYYQPTAGNGLLFVSDVPRSYTWRENDISGVSVKDLIKSLLELEFLESLILRKATWVSKLSAIQFLIEAKSVSCNNLSLVDFRDAGMLRGLNWAIRASPQTILTILQK